MSMLYSYYKDWGMYPVDANAPADCESMVIPCCFTLYEGSGEPEMCRALSGCVGSIKGCLILGQEIERRKPGPFVDGDLFMNMICDEMSADLGFVVSALCKDGGPLSVERSLYGLNHFYIDEVSVKRPARMLEILREIPEIVFRHLHVFPEILSYYPNPLPHDCKATEPDEPLLSHLLNDAMVYLTICDEDAPEYGLTPEQLVTLREMHQNATSYPAQYIDKSLWHPFLDAGFTEYANTRVLYKSV